MGGGVHSRPMTVADMAAAAHEGFTDMMGRQNDVRRAVEDGLRGTPASNANLRRELEQRAYQRANILRQEALQTVAREAAITARAADIIDQAPPQVAQLAGGAAGAVQNAIPVDIMDDIPAMMSGMMTANIPQASVAVVGERARRIMRDVDELDSQLRGYRK